MQTIPPRLNHLLNILTLANTPIPVTELARQCGVSRRTIFREIENIAGLLRPYRLNIGTKVGEGIYLAGDEKGRKNLREILETKSAARPSERYGRRILLALDLLTCGEVQKLFYYANSFQVSEATVSNDLDSLDEKLNKFEVHILRKPGHGIAISGSEAAVRKAICALLLEAGRSDIYIDTVLVYPPAEITAGVNQLMATRFRPQLLWMTEESREALATYLAVTVERVTGHNTVNELAEQISLAGSLPAGKPWAAFLPIADFFANSLELRFSLVFSEWERENLAVYLSALRQSASYLDYLDNTEQPVNDYSLKSLAYQMIEYFDPELSPFLKLDDRLVDGLAQHLETAAVRIKNRVELNDPLFAEIARTYPEILEKSRRALHPLRTLNPYIPESEASFLATHFGAAVMRIKEQSIRRLNIGVVCAGGIGTSYFMVSQLKKHFVSGAEFEICGLADGVDWGRFDLCITTIPLEAVPIPTVAVNLVLEDADVAAIRAQIETITAAEKQITTARSVPLRELCQNAGGLLEDVTALLTWFDAVTIECNCDFDHLAKLAGYRFGGLEESGRLIYDDIIRRESLSTQVVPSLELILLHARTDGVKRPVFSLILPENGRFTAPALQNSRCCVVMLAPLKASADTLNLLGRISSALLEDTAFLTAVLAGDKTRVYRGLEENFRDYLAHTINF